MQHLRIIPPPQEIFKNQILFLDQEQIGVIKQPCNYVFIINSTPGQHVFHSEQM